MKTALKTVIAFLFIQSCSVYEDPKANQSQPDATPTYPAIPTPVAQTSTITDPGPQPDSKLWKDPVTNQYWLIGGEGTPEFLLALCVENYRMATYNEVLRAAIDGLRHDYPDLTLIWTSQTAYFDPSSGNTYNYYADLTDSQMKPGLTNDVHTLACIWDPEQ